MNKATSNDYLFHFIISNSFMSYFTQVHIFPPHPTSGTILTRPNSLVQTYTRLQQKSPSRTCPIGINTAVTYGLSLSIAAFALSPLCPINSGHRCRPPKRTAINPLSNLDLRLCRQNLTSIACLVIHAYY